ncbi:MAG: hypothetical protein KAV87_54460 [Desulfobacteraceae bacterium]|nr:hypothetical protein [Desulfobacteraceae bacterium]
MNTKNKAIEKHRNQKKKENHLKICPEVGRILITCPRYGRADIYVKRDKRLGATFICEEDGGRYGITPGVKKRFQDTGSYTGWGYIGANQTVVFKFLLGEQSNTPESLIVIKTSNGNVDLSASIKNREGGEYADGAVVAFYARFVRRSPANHPRRAATDVFPVDADHLPLTARLISAGRLTFPDHNEVLQLFFDSLPSIKSLDQQNLSLFDSALAYLATNPSVPSQFQGLARVERCKLSLLDNARAANAPQQAPRYANLQEGYSVKPKVGRSSKGRIVTDVIRVDLQIGKD